MRAFLMSLASLMSLCLAGCPSFTCTSYEAGVSAGRTFADGDVLAPGATVWGATLKARFDRDRR